MFIKIVVGLFNNVVIGCVKGCGIVFDNGYIGGGN